MKFLLAQELFRDEGGDPHGLLTILRLAFEGRHVVCVEEGADFAAWLGRRSDPERDWVRRAVDDSLRSAPHIEKVVVRVCAAASSRWSARPPELTVADACALAHAPLRLVLEDFEDDAHFLRWLGGALDDPFWRRVDYAMRRGWAEVVHGGGTGSMLRLVKALDDGRTDLPWGMVDASDRLKPSQRAQRTWVMFDHDGVEPGDDKRGPTPLKLVEHTAKRGVRGHGLARRSIENYLPLVLLRRWAKGDFDDPDRMIPPEERGRRHVLVDAFARLKPIRQHHYYFREGLRKDARRDGTLPPVWAPTEVDDLWALACGFDALDHDGITRLFGHPGARVKASVLRDDGSHDEAKAILRSVAEAL